MKEERRALKDLKEQHGAATKMPHRAPKPYHEEGKDAKTKDFDQYSSASKSAIDRAFAREYGDDLELSSK
eukprot:CAMPEP_0196994786 /NCGR_PEP_ID=MMETSP1380-20130617/1025_1 /TAXON_ID=5936 /ORGANISM="Euplotes crassus, Strain CT5" /LENGTH=69 /DNA_ID=CAMNT_0042410251 /DNA_START=38 /DNA_END=247 /DNA_ORIENTATION=+